MDFRWKMLKGRESHLEWFSDARLRGCRTTLGVKCPGDSDIQVGVLFETPFRYRGTPDAWAAVLSRVQIPAQSSS